MSRKKARPEVPPADSPAVSDDDEGDYSRSFPLDMALDGEIEQIGDVPDDALDGSPVARSPEADRGAQSDSSSDGDFNPVGDIPMRWYEGYDHIGYNRGGEQIIPENKPSALDLAADPHAWRRIYDEKNDTQLLLSHEELRAISRIRAGRYPSGADDPAVDEAIGWAGPVENHPLKSGPEPKRRFLPSRHEARTVIKMVRAMRAGKLRRPSEVEQDREKELEARYNYDVWEQNEPKDASEMSKNERAREIMRVTAPKVSLPKHEESYNPPEEYLPTAEEAKAWEATDPEDRVTNFLPTKYESLRHVPGYDHFINERFERCLDLYLAVRVRRDPQRVNPEDLIPELPSPQDLRPFPSGRSASIGPLPSRARSISVHPGGLWLLTGSDDGFVRLWEISSGCERFSLSLGSRVPKLDGAVPPITCVSWLPKDSVFVFAATVGATAFVVSCAGALGVPAEESDDLLSPPAEEASSSVPSVSWSVMAEDAEDSYQSGDSSAMRYKLLAISHPRTLQMVTWHHKGDYFATVGKDSSGGTVAIHRLSQQSSQTPFKKKTAGVQTVRFHPTRPFFFVATKHSIRIYNLAAQEAVKTLKPGVRWISSIDIHPSGDHVLVGSYDKRLCWFDLDLSTRPYKAMRNHSHAVRAALYHPRLPLFASCADDGSAHVFHGTVYDDLNRNALIVPLKKLESFHTITKSLGVLDMAWHPRLPWLITSGADRGIHIFSDIS